MDLSLIKARPTNRAIGHPTWALILGGAECVWEDERQWEWGICARLWDGLLFAVNDVGCHWHRALDHWVSSHSQKFDTWKQQRMTAGYPRPYATWGRHLDDPVDFVLYPWAAGSSGMLAVQVAIELGCTRVVLCGMPMTQTPHFADSREFDAASTEWRDADFYWRGWLRIAQTGWFEDRVRSMSGRTRDLLGAPSLEWLTT